MADAVARHLKKRAHAELPRAHYDYFAEISVARSGNATTDGGEIRMPATS